MATRFINREFFIIGLFTACLLSLGFQFFFNSYVTFSVDDFWFAHRIYQYKDGIPYRDFAPYKTVLGYYVLLLPMLLAKGIPHALIVTKNFIAMMNTIILFIAALWLTKYFSRISVLISVLLLLFSDVFLYYSTNIRVDLIGYWFGLFAVLNLLDRRYILAGVLLGLGFACTQKIIWYFLASNIALFSCWMFCNRKPDYFFKICLFNLTAFAVIVCYIVLWSLFSDFNTVYNSLFGEASIMYQLTWYDAARLLFWSSVTLYNPVLFLFWPFAFICALVSFNDDDMYVTRLFITMFSLTILVCLIPYKQIFPYYMQVTYPAFLLLYTAFFSWLINMFKREKIIFLIPPIFIWVFLLAYLILFICVSVLFVLPKAYILFTLIPMLIVYYITNAKEIDKEITSLFKQLLLITFLIIGIAFPLILFSTKILETEGRYQRATLEAVNSLVNDGSDYVAGIELLYNKTQPISGMRHLMGPAISFLYEPTPELRKVMLASLYEDPNATVDNIIEAFKKSNVKFIVNNYRMHAIPKKLASFLLSQYEHAWGSIYIYSPRINPGESNILVKFSGQYLIETRKKDWISLNNNKYRANSKIKLRRGEYHSNSYIAYRLRYLPDDAEKIFPAKYMRDQWERVIN